MRITCPACNASYDVPDAMLGVGRSVRCVRCLREWQPQPASPARDAALTENVVPPAFEVPAFEDDGLDLPRQDRPRFTADDLDTTPPPAAPLAPIDAHAWRDVLLAQGNAREPAAAGRRDGWIGWLASLVLLAVLAAAAVAWRSAAQRAWPPSARVYGALGLEQGRPKAPPLDSAKGSPLESTSK